MPHWGDPRMPSEGSWGAFDLLTKLPEARSDTIFLNDLNKSQATQSSLEKLPTELLRSVFENIEDFSDFALQLGVCSKTMWNRVIGYILDDRRSHMGGWAGTKILCAAETIDDFHESLQSEACVGTAGAKDWFKLATDHFQAPRSGENWHELFDPYVEALEEGELSDDWDQAERSKLWFWSCASVLKPRAEAVLHELREPLRCKTWMLRNLTEKSYVRLQLIRDTKRCVHRSHTYVVHVDGAPQISLDKLLVRRICWSGRDEQREGLKGGWAGHRFDVVESRLMEPEHEGWMDVTGRILSELLVRE